MAEQFRTAAKLQPESIFSCHAQGEALDLRRDAVEKLGVSVFQFRFPRQDGIRGIALHDNLAPAVVMNSAEYPQARSFSLFHEVAHQMLHQEVVCDMVRPDSVDEQTNVVEVKCNSFAGAVLVPRDLLLAEKVVTASKGPTDWPDEALLLLSNKYKVSTEVILRRLLDLGRTSEPYYSRRHAIWRARDFPARTRGGPPIYVRRVAERGAPFVDLVLRSLSTGVLSIGDACDYLGVKVGTIPAVAQYASVKLGQ